MNCRAKRKRNSSGWGGLDYEACGVGPRLLPHALQVRVEAWQGSGRWAPVVSDGPECIRAHSGRARPEEEASADDVNDGPVSEGGSDLRPDLQALPRQPEGLRGGLQEGVVQADASRHGPADAALGASRARGAVVARPGRTGQSDPE